MSIQYAGLMSVWGELTFSCRDLAWLRHAQGRSKSFSQMVWAAENCR